MEKYFNVLMILVFVVLVISIFFSLFRTIIGPRRAVLSLYTSPN